MESTNLQMQDLFEADAVDDDDLGAMAPMPDLDGDDGPMQQEGEDEDGEVNEDVLKRLKDLKGAAKKRVLRPQPKLNVDRLKTERGLGHLSEAFAETKFRGRGHEAEDLRNMMGKLEHWAHRLYPKMTFDEFVDRLERLGQKRPVQTCLTKIRLGMPLVDDAVVEQGDADDEQQQEDEEQAEGPNEDDVDAEEAFEEMLKKEREKQQKDGAAGATQLPPPGGNGTDAQPDSGLDQQTEAELMAALDSEDDWSDNEMDTQPPKAQSEDNAELNLRLTATENTEATENDRNSTSNSQSNDPDASQKSSQDSSQKSLDLHLTTTEESETSTQKSSQQDSQDPDLNLHLTESKEVTENKGKSNDTDDVRQVKNPPSQRSNIDNNSDKEEKEEQKKENLILRLTESELPDKDMKSDGVQSTDKADISNSEEQESNELNLNVSTSDSEMTAEES